MAFTISDLSTIVPIRTVQWIKMALILRKNGILGSANRSSSFPDSRRSERRNSRLHGKGR